MPNILFPTLLAILGVAGVHALYAGSPYQAHAWQRRDYRGLASQPVVFDRRAETLVARSDNDGSMLPPEKWERAFVGSGSDGSGYNIKDKREFNAYLELMRRAGLDNDLAARSSADLRALDGDGAYLDRRASKEVDLLPESAGKPVTKRPSDCKCGGKGLNGQRPCSPNEKPASLSATSKSNPIFEAEEKPQKSNSTEDEMNVKENTEKGKRDWSEKRAERPSSPKPDIDNDFDDERNANISDRIAVKRSSPPHPPPDPDTDWYPDGDEGDIRTQQLIDEIRAHAQHVRQHQRRPFYTRRASPEVSVVRRSTLDTNDEARPAAVSLVRRAKSTPSLKRGLNPPKDGGGGDDDSDDGGDD